MEAYNSKQAMEDQKKLLTKRREKLKALLESDREQFEQELKKHNPVKEILMKERATLLRSRREQERKKVAEEKLHELWRVNCPDIRELESQLKQQSIQEEWENQIQQKRLDIELTNREKQRHRELLNEESLAALRLEEEKKKKQRVKEKEHAKMLKQQMAEIKQREEEVEAMLLERQQTMLMQQQVELENAEEQRRKLEQVQRKAATGRILLHQHKAQMRRKSQQIQEALELDVKILTDLAEKESLDRMLHKEKREKAKANAEWMKQVILDQLMVEKEREAELDILYQEEVVRMWNKREAEWEKEKVARERLISEVMAERQQQIHRKIDYLKDQQAESIRYREKLLKEMESYAELTGLQSKQKEEEQARRAKELREQIEERQMSKKLAQVHCEGEIEAQRCAKEEYEVLMQEEKEKMTGRKFEPKVYAKKKYAWC